MLYKEWKKFLVQKIKCLEMQNNKITNDTLLKYIFRIKNKKNWIGNTKLKNYTLQFFHGPVNLTPW